MQRASTKSINSRPIQHRGGQYTGLFFSYDSDIISKVKTLPWVRYSSTKQCWYTLRNERCKQALQNLGIPIIEETKASFKRRTEQTSEPFDNASIAVRSANTSVRVKDGGKLSSDINPKGIELKEVKLQGGVLVISMNYNRQHVDFLKSLKVSYWDAKERKWVVKASLKNVTQLQQYFCCWDSEQYQIILNFVDQDTASAKVRLRVYNDQFYGIQIWNAPEIINWIKTQTGRKYIKDKRQWLLARSKGMVEEVSEICKTYNARFLDHTPKQHTYDRHVNKGDWGAYKKYQLRKYPKSIWSLLKPYLDLLVLERYSKNTIKSYTNAFARFLLDCDEKKLALDALEMVHIKPYLMAISEQDIAYQTLNRHYSAIQFWYEKVGLKGSFYLGGLSRPRKAKPLPKVLSKGEVSAIFGQLNNLKHRCMLYLAYGAGLRSGEVVHLRKHDIQFERNEIRVCKGKGAKDRVVMLSDGMSGLLRKYIAEYEPSFWLFEGQDKRQPYTSAL